MAKTIIITEEEEKVLHQLLDIDLPSIGFDDEESLQLLGSIGRKLYEKQPD